MLRRAHSARTRSQDLLVALEPVPADERECRLSVRSTDHRRAPWQRTRRAETGRCMISIAFSGGIRRETKPPRAIGCRRTPQRSHVGGLRPVADQPAGGAARTGMSGPARQASKGVCLDAGQSARVSACQRSSAIDRRMRSPFVPPGHHLPLPKRLKGAILASSRRESGECRFNRIQASHT